MLPPHSNEPPDKAEEAADSDAAGKSGGFLIKVARTVDKVHRWYLESDEPDATGRWSKDHRPKVLAYVHDRERPARSAG